jgi:hypothetical protein
VDADVDLYADLNPDMVADANANAVPFLDAMGAVRLQIPGTAVALASSSLLSV